MLHKISPERMREDLFYLCKDPLPFRKVNFTRSGQELNSLEEADVYIREQLEKAGCQVAETVHRVQAFRCDKTKNIHHWYSPPLSEDPWYAVKNLEVTFPGNEKSDEIIQLISHKDSMSWIDSPGAHDNCVGTVANLELARILAICDLRRTVRILFCNEEHTPWTSRAAAEAAARRGDNLIAVLNVDSLDSKTDEDMAAGSLKHAVLYSTDEGRGLAEFLEQCAGNYTPELEVQLAYKEKVNDDDGMFIKAGFKRTVMNIGSFPFGDSEYHRPGDIPERVNIENLVLSTQLLLAGVLEISRKT